MLAIARDWKQKREELKGQRAALHARFEKCPDDLTLALQLKAIDDQIAECTERLVQVKRQASKEVSNEHDN